MEEAATKPSEDEIKFDETEHRRDMVSCTGGCGEWYNEECMPIPKQVRRKKFKNISGSTVATAK